MKVVVFLFADADSRLKEENGGVNSKKNANYTIKTRLEKCAQCFPKAPRKK